MIKLASWQLLVLVYTGSVPFRELEQFVPVLIKWNYRIILSHHSNISSAATEFIF